MRRDAGQSAFNQSPPDLPAGACALSGSLKHIFVPPVDSFSRVKVLHIQRRSHILSVEGTPVTQ